VLAGWNRPEAPRKGVNTLPDDVERSANERAIFENFARVSGLRIRMDSIESRLPSEPDIRCDIAGEGPVAFELGEIVSEALRRETNEQVLRRDLFRQRYEALPMEDRAAIEACLGGPPFVLAGFRTDVNIAARRRVVRPILDVLLSRARSLETEERLREGDLPFRWLIPALEELLTDLEVHRSRGASSLGGFEMTEAEDRTRYLLEKKFAKRYRTDAPIELLAYYAGFPPSDSDWSSEALSILNSGLAPSQFRRVWFFDMHTVTFVYPPVGPGAIS
jgi:hypothetical protein